MSSISEDAVARHYGAISLERLIFQALDAAGLDPDRLTPDQLAPIDEFHIGGRQATQYALAKLSLALDDQVLDVGCGLGGAMRYLAATVGCRVTGIDLTASYIELAEQLTARTGLGERASYHVGSALQMPFAAEAFDAAYTFHVAMNISDREGLYSEIARVLKPGAGFCVYDVMRGEVDGVRYPVPWAETAQTSHLTTPAEMRDLLDRAGFQIETIEDRSAFGIEFFRQRLAASAGPPPLGLHLLMGSNAREKFENMLHALELRQAAPVLMLAQRKRDGGYEA